MPDPGGDTRYRCAFSAEIVGIVGPNVIRKHARRMPGFAVNPAY